MGPSLFARGLDISIASKHFRSSSASRADINSPGPTFGCPGSTSTFLGRHILPWAGTRFPRAGIGGSRPTYVGPGSTPALLGRHISLLGQNSRLQAGIYLFRPLLARTCGSWAGSGFSGAFSAFLAGFGSPGLDWQSRLGRRPAPMIGRVRPVFPLPLGPSWASVSSSSRLRPGSQAVQPMDLGWAAASALQRTKPASPAGQAAAAPLCPDCRHATTSMPG
jgi:hypothetical protein